MCGKCVGVYLDGAHFHGLAGIGVDGFMAAAPVNGERGAKVRVHHPFVDRDCEHWVWCLQCVKAASVLDWNGVAWKILSCVLGGLMVMWYWSMFRVLYMLYTVCLNRLMY